MLKIKKMGSETRKIFAGIIFLTLVILFVAFSLNIDKFKTKTEKNIYTVYATFKRISSLNIGSSVYISGIKSGKVTELKLNEDYTVRAKLDLDINFKLPEDSTFAIHTDGLMGNKYIEISVGGDDENLISNNGNASYTQDSVDLDELIEQILAMAKRKNEKTKGKKQ